jgi:predicted phage terminase large subunit-like protein
MTDFIGPISHKQELFVRSQADVTIFGGAAGSGKSEIGVIDFLKNTDTPGFIGLITRRTIPQLKGPGGIHSKCKHYFNQVYGPDGYIWREKDGKFIFPSGAEIFLKHYQTEADYINYQGVEANQFLIDEGTQFSLDMVSYIMSRMRNPKCPSVQPHMKITCNPDADHFLRAWVDWYLQDDGRPDVSKDGIIRYFGMDKGEYVFGDTREEVMLITGNDDPEKVLSYTFISANVYDNPVVMEINPKYVAWLEGLKPVEKERLLYGNWNAREASAGFFSRDWCELVALPPVKYAKRVRSWDLSGTLPSDSNRNPDWTVGTLVSKTSEPFYYVEDVVRERRRHGGVLELILETARHDGFDTTVVVPVDPGAAGKAYAASIQRELAERGYYCRLKPASGSKVNRFAPFASMAEAGGVRVVRGLWNDVWFLELEVFDGSRNIKDDQVDSVADGYIMLATDMSLPSFTPPDMSKTNPFNI